MEENLPCIPRSRIERCQEGSVHMSRMCLSPLWPVAAEVFHWGIRHVHCWWYMSALSKCPGASGFRKLEWRHGKRIVESTHWHLFLQIQKRLEAWGGFNSRLEQVKNHLQINNVGPYRLVQWHSDYRSQPVLWMFILSSLSLFLLMFMSHVVPIFWPSHYWGRTLSP